MYSKLCESLRKSFEKKIQILDKLPLPKYIEKIEEFKLFNGFNTDDTTKEKKNILTPRIQKKRQFSAILKLLEQSGAYVFSAEDDTSDKIWGGYYRFDEVKRALKGTSVALYKKQPKDKRFESCISHGGYTLIQKEQGSNSWTSNTFFKVKDKSDTVRIIKRVPFFDRRFKNHKKAMDDLQKNVHREFLDSTGRIKTLTDLNLIPKVHNYFVCFSENPWGDSRSADIYVVQDYVDGAIGLDEYIKENKESLNKDTLDKINKIIETIVKQIYSKTMYRYSHDFINYNNFICELKKDKKTIQNIYLKNADTLIHKDVEQERVETEQEERSKREQKLLEKLTLLTSKTMRNTEKMQMDVAIMMMVKDNILGVSTTDKDVEIKREIGLQTRKSKSSRKSSMKNKL